MSYMTHRLWLLKWTSRVCVAFRMMCSLRLLDVKGQTGLKVQVCKDLKAPAQLQETRADERTAGEAGTKHHVTALSGSSWRAHHNVLRRMRQEDTGRGAQRRPSEQSSPAVANAAKGKELLKHLHPRKDLAACEM